MTERLLDRRERYISSKKYKTHDSARSKLTDAELGSQKRSAKVPGQSPGTLRHPIIGDDRLGKLLFRSTLRNEVLLRRDRCHEKP
jgi:hypothetical protein